MKFLFFILHMMFVFLTPWSFAGNFNCDPYVGKPVSVPAKDEQVFDKAVSAIRKKEIQTLRSMSEGELLFVRRFVSGEIEARGGNVWERISVKQIDGNMEIHIGEQKIKDFSGPTVFYSVKENEGIALEGSVCKGRGQCDILPVARKLETLLYGLLKCNKNQGAIFLFSDGALLTDMEFVNDTAVGIGIFFSKSSEGYHLSSLFSMQ